MTQAHTTDLNDAIGTMIQHKLDHLRTACPGRIVEYDTKSGTVSVKLMIQEPYLDEDGEVTHSQLPLITGVPIAGAMHQSGGFTVPIEIGEQCLVIFSDRSLDEWMASNKEPVVPSSDHTHNVTDAIAILGLIPRQKTISKTHTEMIHRTDSEDQAISLKVGEILIGRNATERMVLGTESDKQITDALSKAADAIFATQAALVSIVSAMTAAASTAPPLGTAAAAITQNLSTLAECATQLKAFSTTKEQRLSTLTKVK